MNPILSRKCPNHDVCQSRGNTDASQNEHYVLKSCPENGKTDEAYKDEAATSGENSRYNLRRASKRIFSSANKFFSESFEDLKNSVSTNFNSTKQSVLNAILPSKQIDHRCANYEKCKGIGNTTGKSKGHYLTKNCPVEFDKKILKSINDAKRIYVEPATPSPRKNPRTSKEEKENDDIQSDELSTDDEVWEEETSDDDEETCEDDVDSMASSSHSDKFETLSHSIKNKISKPLMKLSSSLSNIYKY